MRRGGTRFWIRFWRCGIRCFLLSRISAQEQIYIKIIRSIKKVKHGGIHEEHYIFANHNIPLQNSYQFPHTSPVETNPPLKIIIIAKPMISQIQIRSVDQLLLKRSDVINANALPVGLPDASAYYYFKEGSFFKSKEQHWTFHFFQGLNANPQNLSIHLRDQAQRQNKINKEKLIKGVFIIYDLFSKADIVIQINIPGNLKIYKWENNKKQLVSNEEIDLMYLSSAFRTMYQTNLPWGRSYLLFHDSKNFIQEFRNFFTIAFRSLLRRDINVGGQFQSSAKVKGSHACSLILNYVKQRKLVRHAIEIIEELLGKNEQYLKCSKYGVLLAQLYLQHGKPSKSLSIIFTLLQTYPAEPFLLYYQARYLFQSNLHDQALTVANSIVQYNQLQVWLLLAQIHQELKSYGQLLICLNHAVRMSKIKSTKNTDNIYRAFEELGKVKINSTAQGVQKNPKILYYTDTPLTILVKEVQQKNKFLLERGFWKLNSNQKTIYNIIKQLRYKLQNKKFQELLMTTFQDNILRFQNISIKRGIVQAQIQSTQIKLMSQHHKIGKEEEIQDLPDFLKNSIDKVQQQSVVYKPSRLSIIQQIESVIENSNYEQRQKQKSIKKVKLKRQVNQILFRIVQMVLAQSKFQKDQYECNVAVILPIYNKMRTSSKYNNYYAEQMFKIFTQVGNYKSVLVLIAQTLDFLEQRGVRKMDKLPYWMHKYIFFIIEEKGLKYLNTMLQKLNFYDEAIIDTIELAKRWNMKGVTY